MFILPIPQIFRIVPERESKLFALHMFVDSDAVLGEHPHGIRASGGAVGGAPSKHWVPSTARLARHV